MLFKFRGLLEQNFSDVAHGIVRENGKLLSEARGSLRRGLDVVEFACASFGLASRGRQLMRHARYTGCLGKFVGVCMLCISRISATTAGPPPQNGPETEKRFPPLHVPEGFKATLFACDPLVEYPSAVALGPHAGSLFVAADFMTGLGTEILRRDEIRLVEDTDGDGYADRATVFADEFNSIEGLTFHGDRVYAMHSPYLTALRDTDGDGKADERRDLLTGLGLSPEENPHRLHGANGVVMGHDGWLYLALGDHGCNVERPEGDRLVLEGGGILRCRADGRDLHVFATGLRNIYDVALDDELNTFVRDNENDGGDYKIRVCHSFFGADHGYPYLYNERPDEALFPLADLGLGSSAGGLCYREKQFPAEYRSNLFFCEWGRAVVRYVPRREGSGFAPLGEIEFAAGAKDDPYGFKPTDLVVERDGSLIIADWADGQQPKRGRGRIYRVRYLQDGTDQQNPPTGSRTSGRRHEHPENRPLSARIAQLDSKSYYERVEAQESIAAQGVEGIDALCDALNEGRIGVVGRKHAVWILARAASRSSFVKLLDLAAKDPDPRVQCQAVRAVADLADPVLSRHRPDAVPAETQIAARLAEMSDGKSSDVLLEVLVAVGRLRWPDTPGALHRSLSASPIGQEVREHPNGALAHAAQQALRRCGNWPAVLGLLDLPGDDPVRPIALRAIADQAAPQLVDGLIERLADQKTDPERRGEYALALTRVHKKPGPWTYWGYRPAPRPPNSVAWERTGTIEDALDRYLADRAVADPNSRCDGTMRLAVLRSIQREKVPTRLATLGPWLAGEHSAETAASILELLKEHSALEHRGLLARVVADREHTGANRLAALALLAKGLDDASAGLLLELAGAVEDGPVLADLLARLGRQPKVPTATLLIDKLNSPNWDVRRAAVEAITELRLERAGPAIERLLDDTEAPVRRAAAAAAGRLGARSAIEALLRLAVNDDPLVRRASFESLRALREPRVVPLAIAALADRQTQMAAIDCIDDLGGPDQAQALVDLANGDPSIHVVTRAIGFLTKWTSENEVPVSRRDEFANLAARLQGQSGNLVRWQARGPLSESAARQLVARLEIPAQLETDDHSNSPPDDIPWRTLLATGLESRVKLVENAQTASRTQQDPVAAGAGKEVWIAFTDFVVPEPAAVQFLGSAAGTWRVWLNGRSVFERDESGPLRPDADRFDATLVAGLNRLVVEIATAREGAQFQLRFRRKSSAAEHEKLVHATLSRSGKAELGRKLFFDTAKTLCSKCHHIEGRGERIGPELTGLGDRFSRIHIVESILEPSRTVAPGYQTLAVALKSGLVVTGTKIAETGATLTLGDNQGSKHTLAKADIDEMTAQSQSIMPDGLVKELTVDEFVDLIEYLTSQKELRAARR
jgi:putative membrane-bound dehydrogenase-like protein